VELKAKESGETISDRLEEQEGRKGGEGRKEGDEGKKELKLISAVCPSLKCVDMLIGKGYNATIGVQMMTIEMDPSATSTSGTQHAKREHFDCRMGAFVVKVAKEDVGCLSSVTEGE
jgi:hypothetical protein